MSKGYSYFPSGHLNQSNWFSNLLSSWLNASQIWGSETPPADPPADFQRVYGTLSNGYARGKAITGAAFPVENTVGFWSTSSEWGGNPFPEYGQVPGYRIAYANWEDKQTRSKLYVDSLRVSTYLMLRYCRSTVIPYMLARPDIWSDDDLEAAGVRPRRYSHKSPIPPPQIQPIISVKTGQSHDVKVTVAETLSGGAIRYLVATKGIRGCRIDWRYTPNGGSPTDIGWNHVYTTRLKEVLNFPALDAGKFVEIRAAFTNPRIQIGPFSPSVQVVIT